MADTDSKSGESAGSPRSGCWTAPSDIPPDVAKKILAARDALNSYNVSEAFHQLYSIADPTFGSYEPWEILEKQSNQKLSDTADERKQ